MISLKILLKSKNAHLPAAYLLSATDKKRPNLDSVGMFLISLLDLRSKLIGPLKVTSLLLHISLLLLSVGLPVANAPDVLQPCGLLY